MYEMTEVIKSLTLCRELSCEVYRTPLVLRRSDLDSRVLYYEVILGSSEAESGRRRADTAFVSRSEQYLFGVMFIGESKDTVKVQEDVCR